MAVVIAIEYGGFCRFEEGEWRSENPRLSGLLNDHHRAHAQPCHPDPDGQALELARQVVPVFEVIRRDRPGKPIPKDPQDCAPNWLQCLFDPEVTLLPIRRLLSGNPSKWWK